jgi:hypothetical protein
MINMQKFVGAGFIVPSFFFPVAARPVRLVSTCHAPCRNFRHRSTIGCLPIEEETRHGHGRSEDSLV